MSLLCIAASSQADLQSNTHTHIHRLHLIVQHSSNQTSCFDSIRTQNATSPMILIMNTNYHIIILIISQVYDKWCQRVLWRHIRPFMFSMSDVGLTVGHEKLGDEVNVPVPSSAHGLGRSVWKTEALVQLWKKTKKQKHKLHPVRLKPMKLTESEALRRIWQRANEDNKNSSWCTGSKMRDIKYIDWFYRSQEAFTSSRGVMEELSPP